MASSELQACSSPPNGSVVPGFLLPLTFPSIAAWDNLTTSDFESCQDRPNSYFQAQVLAKPEIVIA